MNQGKKLRFIDFFSGIGGMRRGMELAGHRCVGFCEYDKYAVASYTSMYLITDQQREYLGTLTLKQRQKEILKEEYRNGEWYSNDIRNVHAGTLPAGGGRHLVLRSSMSGLLSRRKEGRTRRRQKQPYTRNF